ncbi:hypothetical protein OHU23_41235 (plasmid) [Streptomyces virginiae]|uniref:hypothetical protein n=1 Tax=Streptomyces virginiae TaxID=1961 RepID=UPI002F90BC81
MTAATATATPPAPVLRPSALPAVESRETCKRCTATAEMTCDYCGARLCPDCYDEHHHH